MSTNALSVDHLVERLHDGDEAALADLISYYRDALWQMITFRMDQRLSGRIDPGDVIQDAYLEAHKRLTHFLNADPAPSFLVWMRSIVQQHLIDLHRRHFGSQRRDVRREVAMDRKLASPATSICLAAQLAGQFTSPSHRAMRGELTQVIEQALSQMDSIDREVLALRHFEELGNNEVAEILNLTPSAASNRYFRALRRLKRILAEIPGLTEEGP